MLLTTPGAALASTAPVDLYAPTALYTMYKLLSTYDTNETKTDKYRHAYISNDTTEELTNRCQIGGVRVSPLRFRLRLQHLPQQELLLYLPQVETRRDMDKVREQGKSRSIGIGTVHLQVTPTTDRSRSLYTTAYTPPTTHSTSSASRV